MLFAPIVDMFVSIWRFTEWFYSSIRAAASGSTFAASSRRCCCSPTRVSTPRTAAAMKSIRSSAASAAPSVSGGGPREISPFVMPAPVRMERRSGRVKANRRGPACESLGKQKSRQRSVDALHPDEVPRAARLHRRRSLIAAPWIFQFSEHTAATIVPIVLGIGLIAYSLFTNYELGVWKVAPMAVHNLIDIAAGGLLAASPWIFGFADETANVWVPTSSSASPRSSSA